MSDLDIRATPQDVVSVLLDCHEGTRQHLALARAVAHVEVLAVESVSRMALRVRRYFERVLPLHMRDEEESLLPRLRGVDPALDEELNARVREHRDYSRAVAALVVACGEVVRVPARLPRVAPYLGRIAAELDSHFERHLAHEERVIFPAALRFLDAPASAAAMLEIHRRWLGPGLQLTSPRARRCA